jgi:hypothetical protein
MCQTCYKDYGSPKIITPATLEAAKLIEEVFEWSSGGGNLHIVIDDWNLDDDSLDFCDTEIRTDDPSCDEKLEAERKCLDALRKMTLEERASTLAIHDEFIKVE